MSYQPKNILVTGGAGFIGANFIHHVLKQNPNSHLVNIDKLTYAGSLSYLDTLPDSNRYHFIKGDICDLTLVHDTLEEFNIDTIVHFAAESHVDRSIAGPAEFIKTNIIGTFTLLEAAKQYWLKTRSWDETNCRFHHISTDEVFGSLQLTDPAFSETTAYDPRSPYSASKASSDHLVNAYYHTYGLPITLSNCSNNYGPFQHPEKFIPTVIRSCMLGQAIPIYGAGNNIRDWLYVEDHCDAIWQIITHAQTGEHYNIGGHCELSNTQLAHMICEYFDKHHPRNRQHASLITHVTDRPGHDFRYAIDTTKITASLHWKPQTSIQEGLVKTIQYYLAKFETLASS